MLSSTSCTLCGSPRYHLLHDMGWRRVLRCAECGLVRADPLPTLAEKAVIETRGYTDEHAAFPEARNFFANCHRNYVEDPVIRGMRRHLGALETVLGGLGALLDVGAGTGIFMHLARERGWETAGIDICPLSADKARQEFDVEVAVGPFEDHHFDGRRFDAVTMLDVLEHVPDPRTVLQRVHELLRPGGAVCIAVPNQRSLVTAIVDRYARAGGPFAGRLLPRLYVEPHLHYFTPRTMRHLVTASGFRVHTLRQGSVYLGRYRLPIWMRVPLEITLGAGALIGMNARINVVAVK